MSNTNMKSDDNNGKPLPYILHHVNYDNDCNGIFLLVKKPNYKLNNLVCNQCGKKFHEVMKELINDASPFILEIVRQHFDSVTDKMRNEAILYMGEMDKERYLTITIPDLIITLMNNSALWMNAK